VNVDADSVKKGATVAVRLSKVANQRLFEVIDELATEEPMEIRLNFWQDSSPRWLSVSVTMRTPGSDFELAAGFLFTEGLIKDRSQVERISYCLSGEEKQWYNIVNVYLRPGVRFDPTVLNRHFYVTSSCGVCGKACLEALRVKTPTEPFSYEWSVCGSVVAKLPNELRKKQRIFGKTGGLHACGLFDADGNLLDIREDVGRHNALDKLVGGQFLSGKIPLRKTILVVSGRASFEIMQKSLMAGAPVVVSVGAPSSLAVELAKQFSMTLVGFAREDGYNIYSGIQRIRLATS
jgi:FdhD protein